MRAGELRHRIELQAHTQERDEWNTPLPAAWNTFATIWADVRHLSGTESIKAMAETSTVRASCRVRYRTDVTAGHRVVFEDKIYDIEAVLPDAKRQFVDLLLKTNGQAAEEEEPPYSGGWG